MKGYSSPIILPSTHHPLLYTSFPALSTPSKNPGENTASTYEHMSCLVTNYTSSLTKLPFENPGYTHEYDIIEVLYVFLDLVTCIEQVIVVVDSQLSK